MIRSETSGFNIDRAYSFHFGSDSSLATLLCSPTWLNLGIKMRKANDVL